MSDPGWRGGAVGLLVVVALIVACGTDDPRVAPRSTTTPAVSDTSGVPPAEELVDPADNPPDWSDALAAGERTVIPQEEDSRDPELAAVPVAANEYDLTTAINDLQAYRGPFDPAAPRPELSNRYIEMSKVVRTIDRHWADVAEADRPRILELLGVTSPSSGPSKLRAAHGHRARAQATAPPKAVDCTAWERRVDEVRRRLGELGVSKLPPFRVSCNASQEKVASRSGAIVDAYAYALPQGSFSNQIPVCQIVINPLAERGVKLSIAAHEYWHCVEAFQTRGETRVFDAVSDWAIEGQAAYVGWSFDHADTEWWDFSLDSPGSVSLFRRTYDAIGMYIQLHHTLPGGQTDMIPLLIESWASAPSDEAMFETITRGNRSFRATWASSRMLQDEGRFGEGWDTEPGYHFRPDPLPVAELDPAPKPLELTANDYATAGARVRFTDTVDVAVVNVTSGWGRVTDVQAGGDTNTSPNYFLVGSVALCGPGQSGEPEPCVCPGLPDLDPPPPLGSGNEMYVAVAGAQGGGELLTFALSLEDYCEAKGQPATPPVPGACRYLGAKDLDAYNLGAALIVNQEVGDDQERTCHVGYTTINADVDAPTRVLDVRLLVSTTRPPILAGTLPDPVRELGKRATRDPDNPDGFSRFGQGRSSTGGVSVVFACGRRYCTLVLSVFEQPATSDITPIQREAIAIAKVLKKRVR